jgi:hypothetical protein
MESNPGADRLVWVKLRRTQYEQKSSAVDPTADMAPLANTGSSRRRECPRGEIFAAPYNSPARHYQIFTARDEIWDRWTVRSTWMAALHQIGVVPNGWNKARCI